MRLKNRKLKSDLKEPKIPYKITMENPFKKLKKSFKNIPENSLKKLEIRSKTKQFHVKKAENLLKKLT